MKRAKNTTRSRTTFLIATGRLERPETCERCGSDGVIQAHHRNYDDPTDIAWLCRSCHADEHRGDPRRYTPRRGRPPAGPISSDLAERLREAAELAAEAQRELKQARIERREAIIAALEGGCTHAQIAEAAGTTRGRIGQIAMVHRAQKKNGGKS